MLEQRQRSEQHDDITGHPDLQNSKQAPQIGLCAPDLSLMAHKTPLLEPTQLLGLSQ